MDRLRNMDPRKMIAMGFVMVLIGWVLPLLMVIKVIEAGFFLSFFSYTVSLMGLFFGIIGAAFYVRNRKH
ncbi:MAG: hypothetical protein JXB15_06270 [Anaerolineales bacterium]|nr:hypothetical protein [Anaerolineales bacterium]